MAIEHQYYQEQQSPNSETVPNLIPLTRLPSANDVSRDVAAENIQASESTRNTNNLRDVIESLQEGEEAERNELDEETKKQLMILQARDIVLNSDIKDPVAWEKMKFLLQIQFPDLSLSEFPQDEKSTQASTARLVESFFKKRRLLYRKLKEAQHNKKYSSSKADQNRYFSELHVLKDVYYRDVWDKSQQYLKPIELLLTPVQKVRNKKNKTI